MPGHGLPPRPPGHIVGPVRSPEGGASAVSASPILAPSVSAAGSVASVPGSIPASPMVGQRLAVVSVNGYNRDFVRQDTRGPVSTEMRSKGSKIGFYTLKTPETGSKIIEIGAL